MRLLTLGAVGVRWPFMLPSTTALKCRSVVNKSNWHRCRSPKPPRPRVEIGLQDYRDVDDGPYDAISSTGMPEHVGLTRLPLYADKVRGLLSPAGSRNWRRFSPRWATCRLTYALKSNASAVDRSRASGEPTLSCLHSPAEAGAAGVPQALLQRATAC